jgi:hypothetical protein
VGGHQRTCRVLPSPYWIQGSDRRFDGYNFFGVHPELPMAWSDKHIN